MAGLWATLCEPDAFDKALAARKDELENVKIRSCLSMRPRAVIEEDPEGKRFHLLDPRKVVYTFAVGSLALYATTNRNPHFYCHQVDYTNSPHMIMQNEKVVSINNTTQIDLQGQAASESDGHRHISGTGGQLQFVRGAYASKGAVRFQIN